MADETEPVIYFASKGVRKINEERNYQIHDRGYDVSNDADYGDEELACAAMYAVTLHPGWFPKNWAKESMDHIKHATREKRFIIAGALLAAQIDRDEFVLQRDIKRKEQKEEQASKEAFTKAIFDALPDKLKSLAWLLEEVTNVKPIFPQSELHHVILLEWLDKKVKLSKEVVEYFCSKDSVPVPKISNGTEPVNKDRAYTWLEWDKTVFEPVKQSIPDIIHKYADRLRLLTGKVIDVEASEISFAIKIKWGGLIPDISQLILARLAFEFGFTLDAVTMFPQTASDAAVTVLEWNAANWPKHRMADKEEPNETNYITHGKAIDINFPTPKGYVPMFPSGGVHIVNMKDGETAQPFDDPNQSVYAKAHQLGFDRWMNRQPESKDQFEARKAKGMEKVEQMMNDITQNIALTNAISKGFAKTATKFNNRMARFEKRKGLKTVCQRMAKKYAAEVTISFSPHTPTVETIKVRFEFKKAIHVNVLEKFHREFEQRLSFFFKPQQIALYPRKENLLKYDITY